MVKTFLYIGGCFKMENLELKELMVEGLIESLGEENLTKFDKRNIIRYLENKISFDQLLRRIFRR